MSISVAEAADIAVARPPSRAAFGTAAWHRLSLRAKLLLVFIIGVADDEIAEAWENFIALTTVGAGLNIAAIMLLYVLFGRVLEPLTKLATGLRDLESRNYGVRLARPDGRELRAIAGRFNS